MRWASRPGRDLSRSDHSWESSASMASSLTALRATRRLTIGIVHQVGALGTGPPTVKRTLSAMAYDDKISPDVFGEVSDFFRWLACRPTLPRGQSPAFSVVQRPHRVSL